MNAFPLGIAVDGGEGVFDFAEVDPLGLLRLIGWSQRPVEGIALPALALTYAATAKPWSSEVVGTPSVSSIHRFFRPDVSAGSDQALPQTGLVVEYNLSEFAENGLLRLRKLRIGDHVFPVSVDARFVTPHYAHLLDTRRVLGREDIYGEGPPCPVVSPEVLRLTGGLSGRVLDFGCGAGALTLAMRDSGLDAWGLEIDRPAIRQAMPDAAIPYVTLYDGALPTPFEDGAFDAVVSVEVLEHIPNPTKALAEMARLTRDKLLLTVPDIAAIPHGFRHGVVPWHLLEGTHVNFFTQRSLTAVLEPHFKRMEFGRIVGFRVNDTLIHTSLVVVCSR